ncbi:MAG: sigma 54-interacting transcriptional regulator [Candidatus Brocadiia bacterium]
MPSVLIKNGSLAGKLVRLKSPRIRIGRASDSDIQLDDKTVSREHAVLLRRGPTWYVQDLGSHNRVLLNRVPVVSAALIEHDEIRLGSVSMIFLPSEGAESGAGAERARGAEAEITQAINLRGPADDEDSDDRRIDNLLALGGLATTVRTVPHLFQGVQENLGRVMHADRVFSLMREDGAWRSFRQEEGAFGEGVEDLGLAFEVLERAYAEGPVAARYDEGVHLACVPICTAERSMGVIYCERHEQAGPFSDAELRHLFYIAVGLAVALEGLRAREELASRTRSLSRQLAEHFDMVGESQAMKRVYRFIHRVAPTEAGVFVCGESGTGKEMVARAIQRHSRRSAGPLEIVNCAAVPSTLMESELFGHVKGAFTGAVADRPGRFQLAHRGTLFLDEVCELPLECQAKLLRVLEEGKVRPIGDTQDRPVDVRLVAATNQDPRQEVEDGLLRPDLFYRLDRLRIEVPPLRERDGDVRRLALHFLAKFSHQCKRPVEDFDPRTLEIFQAYDWPGNVRELRNVVERMVILSEGHVLEPSMVPDDIRSSVRAANEDVEPLAEVEKRHVERALKETGGNKSRAAELLGIDRSTLYAKIERYGLDG